ncbi:diguanylate cyclase domain-containing protein [Noviherbaspirillum pedocola]|uniref:Diguanylate cyclase n=1 Tax=Noviherbaspirillum pedocola TaxID=2801341 RepID=A0A934SW24_9BURK|nr:diguanylate cyclase [Noviherbaspirillum pedocola]MBK4737881.1 diguanylate cyclase [Noviherbaspirillum pedocola]
MIHCKKSTNEQGASWYSLRPTSIEIGLPDMIGIDAIHDGHILIVDDQPGNVTALTGLLVANGYRRISTTTNGRAVAAMHRAHRYDLILLDMHMPDITGLEVMKQLRAADPEHYLPVIVVTGDQHSRIAALEAGARDFIMKPYDFVELDARIRNTMEVRLLYKAVDESRRLMEQQAQHDALTGLPNRRLLLDRLENTLEQARRQQRQVGLLYMDLDGFKEVNDRYGHACGDRLLVQVAERVRNAVRRADTVARIGGDEFIVLLPEVCDVRDAERPAEKLLNVLREPFAMPEGDVQISGSIGMALYPDNGDDMERLIASADTALYSAKRAGKSRYEIARSLQ